MIILCILIAVAIVIILFFVFAMKCIEFGFDNKYGYDEQMFLEGSQFPPAPIEEDQSDIQ